MANRRATVEDLALYGTYIRPGIDVIIDTPNKDFPDGKGISYYFMGSREFTDLIGDPTFWFDGDKLGKLSDIKFQNEASNKPWSIATATFQNIPGTRVDGKSLSVQGLKYFKLNGEDKLFEGVRHWNTSRKFLTGNFGFRMTQSLANGHGYLIGVQDGGTIEMRGFEAMFGFSGIRINPYNTISVVSKLVLDNFYIHDTCTGEGQYIGGTWTTNIPRFHNVKIKNGIVTRTGAEALQMQHFAGAEVSNINIFAADTDKLHAFQNYQDKGMQAKVGGGVNTFKNIIIDGFGSTGLILSGAPTLEHIPQAVNQTLLHNMLFFDGDGAGIYMQGDLTNGVDIVLSDVSFGQFNKEYYTKLKNKANPYFIFSGERTDKVTITSLYHDGSKVEVFDERAYNIVGPIHNKTINAPRYRNSGFHEKASKVKQWHQYYASYFGLPINTPTQWEVGDIAIDKDLTKNTYELYKCKVAHTATAVRPNSNPNCFTLLTYDINGVRSDQPAWMSLSAQSTLPPDDFRQVQHSEYRTMGILTRDNIIDEYYENDTRVTITESGNRYH